MPEHPTVDFYKSTPETLNADLVRHAIEMGKPVRLSEIKGLNDTQALQLYQSIYNDIPLKEVQKPGSFSQLILTRHSVANYSRMGELADTKPLERVPFLSAVSVESHADISKIKVSDREKGRVSGAELIQREAPKLFSTLSQDSDELFFAASPAERAMQTAMEYRKIAETDANGIPLFHIVEQGEYDAARLAKTGNDVQVQKMDVLQSLEMEVPVYLSDIFCPSSLYPETLLTDDVLDIGKVFAMPAWKEFEAVMPEEARKWKEAKSIVLAQEKSDLAEGRKPSWSGYYERFGSEFKQKFFPLIPEPELTSRVRLSEYQKIHAATVEAFHFDPANTDKNLNSLYFTHDETFFVLHGETVKNCESVRLMPNKNGTTTVLKGGEIFTLKL